MNLILLFESDFIADGIVRLAGRRREHILAVHGVAPGDRLVVGLSGGQIGRGEVLHADAESVEMRVTLDTEPPPPVDVTLVLALPRPKVLNRVLAGAASMGVKRIFLINSWRVEKSYWKSPRLAPENLTMQSVLGLEQSRDTILPVIELHRLFRPFVENELPEILQGTVALVAHPSAAQACPRHVAESLTLAVGPEGGFIEQEIASLAGVGFVPVSLGSRVLRVETAVPFLLGRLQ